MKKNSDQHYQTIIDYINNNTIFWVHDLRQHLNQNNSNVESSENQAIFNILKLLREKKIIQCCENNKSNKQYMVITTGLIEMKQVFINRKKIR